MSEFWVSEFEVGYYDKILEKGLIKKRGLQANWHKITCKKLQAFTDEDINHLDYACGPGTFIGKFVMRNSIGVDISDLQIKYATSKYSNFGNFQTIEEFNFEDYQNYFEIITVAGLLEFLDLEEGKSLILKLKTLVKPNGKIVITTPNYGGAFSLMQKIVYMFSNVNYESALKTKYHFKNLKSLDLGNEFKEVKIKKVITFGWLFSIISLDLGERINNLFEKIVNNKFGFIFLIELKK